MTGPVIDSSVRASLDHIARLRDRIATLTALAEDAETQAAHRIGANLRAAGNDEILACQAYSAFRDACRDRPRFSLVWDANVDVRSARVRGVLAGLRARLQSETLASLVDADSWSGEWPRWGAYCPGPGVHVVYVLFDADLTPCYLGSSSNLANRLRAHAHDGKRFARWQAYRHASRDAAREAETRMLRDVMPYLNRKAHA